MSEQSSQVPAASMATLVTSLATQALGVELPGLPKGEPRPDVAKHLIDTLTLLEEKTKGNLTADEAAMLEQTLHELRLVFISAQKRPAPPSAAPEPKENGGRS
jgi:hypothetical protein